MDETEQVIEATKIQNQFLHALQGLDGRFAGGAVTGAFVSFYAYLEVKGYRDKNRMSFDEFLDKLLEEVKASIKERVKEGDVGI